MRILDKYILTHFIRNFLFGIFCFIIIFILVDMFENLDKFIDKGLNFSLIITYYIYFIPEILKLLIPVGMLLATLFTVSKFAKYSELTSINAAGISAIRFSVPMLIFGAIITLFTIYFNGWIVPRSNSAKFNFERQYLDKNKIAGVIQNLHVQDSENSIITISLYNEKEKSGRNSSIQIFNKNDISRLNSRFDINSMKWDSIKNDWMLLSVSQRNFDSAAVESYKFYDTLYTTDIPGIDKIYLSPVQITNKQLKPEELLLEEQKALIESLEESGQNVSKEKVDYYSKISFPFASIIIILFGLSISVSNRKSGAALQFGFSILIAFVYLGFIKVSQTLGYNGEINPILTAWLANILFLLLAIINLIRKNVFRE
ncbi:MAG TPA: LptF/LptG family permease [Ignavibacteria bacterium]|nr:LptF/LptG family permease [Ignavibacteria bacterium]HMR39211.1 LptF/LptG family permease [Ignavibacteria bacterium]